MMENSYFNVDANFKKNMNRFLGLIEGVIADGRVNEGEAQYLFSWLSENCDIADSWPASVIYKRMVAMLKDGKFDDEELKELYEVVKSTISTSPDKDSVMPTATELPCTEPVPNIVFKGKTFCLTGKFATGSRNACEKMVTERGGVAVSGVSKKLDYLVIGFFVSPDWKFASYGTKIQDVVKNIDTGSKTAIINEHTWSEAVNKSM